jgi:hypothetical protein
VRRLHSNAFVATFVEAFVGFAIFDKAWKTPTASLHTSPGQRPGFMAKPKPPKWNSPLWYLPVIFLLL